MNRSLAVALGLALYGCSPPPTGSVSYLLLDRDAREAGLRVEAGSWQGAPMLPIALRPEEPVAILTSGGRLPVTLRAGALAWVRGGAIEYRAVGAEMEPERLIVDGAEKPVRTLADLLGAETTLRDDGRWTLHASELLTRASFMPVPDGIQDVLPDLIAGAPVAVAAADTVATPAVNSPVAGPGALGVGAGEGPLVGVYFSDGRLLVLDAEGGFTLSSCQLGHVQGRYRRDEERVDLTPASGGEPLVLAIGEGGALRDASGDVFGPVGEEVAK